MFIRQPISIGNLLLDTGNYRIIKQTNQKGARDAIIAEQGKKLVRLAQDIIEHGTNPFDSPMVVDASDGNNNYIVVEGNRRLTAILLMLTPDLAKDTPIHTAFKKLNAMHADSIPKVLDCVIAPDKKSALVWINRKHANGLDGAGTEHWTSISKARADVEQGINRPDLDVINFVLTNPNLDSEVKSQLEGAKFNITTLDRLITTKELQDAASLNFQDGKLVAKADQEWTQKLLTEIVTVIATSMHNEEKFTERTIDNDAKRKTFVEEIVSKVGKKTKSETPWTIAGTPKPLAKKLQTTTYKGTHSTDDQPNLIPKKFKLELPSGKVNDVFVELKKLDVTTYRHSVSVLLRVFLEFTLIEYIKKHSIELPTDKNGNSIDKLSTRLNYVIAHVKTTKLMSTIELKPINIAIGDSNSFLAPDTLNAYVHSVWLNPDPLTLKVSWANLQLFIERLWTSKK